jgi:hypothetical protein
MKFLSWLGPLLVVLAIIASITSPSDKKFTEFINKDKGGDTMSCKPVITKSTDVKLFVRLASIKYVNYCESRTQLVINDKTGGRIPTNYSIPKVTHSETYIGLFGRFWKL